MSGSNLMYELAEGNPGALSVVSVLDWVHLVALKNMNITRSMIWVAYKDIYQENIDKLKVGILDGSIKKLVEATPDYKYEKKQGLR